MYQARKGKQEEHGHAEEQVNLEDRFDALKQIRRNPFSKN